MTRIGPLIALAVLAGAACGPEREAERAIRAAEAALTALPPDAPQVIPAELYPLTAAIAAAKDTLDRGDAAAALEQVREVPVRAAALADTVPIRKAELTAHLDTLRAAMSRNLGLIQATADSIERRRKRRPIGLTDSALTAVKETHTAAASEWGGVQTLAQAGNLAEAMGRATVLRLRVSDALKALGLAHDDRAWGNLTLPR